ncbi:MAG: DUF362 domain-containing protein [Oscillospiraceae bacterium]|nr:DUF362 domain-containing protein [Oscillospiraceae bacterium]
MAKAKVFFTTEITPEAVIKMYEALGVELPGKVAVKLHSGEKGNQNFMRPEFWRPMIEKIGGQVVETNTAYGEANRNGLRDTTASHRQVIEYHGWNKYFNIDIMDEEGETELPIPDGKQLKSNLVGNHLFNYDSMLVLAHFKGHPAGGYGGALKQLSIGCASSAGKARIHSAGRTDNRLECWQRGVNASKVEFPEAMADAAASVVRHFNGKIAYINVMKNLSVDCDCCSVAEDPCMKDIGILASLDPVAIDRACMDLIYAAKDDPGQEHFLQRVQSRNGEHTIEAAEELGYGTTDYELIRI